MINRRPWFDQPAFAAGPNTALLGADVMLWSAAQRHVLYRPQQVTQAAEGSWIDYTRSPLGIGGSWTRNANGGVSFGVVQPLRNNDGLTVAVVAAPSASTNRKVLFSQRLGTGSVAAFSFAANTSNTFGASSGAMVLYCRNTGSTGTPVHAASADPGIDGSTHCWIAANDTGGNGYMVRDGSDVTLTTNTALTGTYVTNAQETRIGNAAAYTTDGAFVCDEPIYLVLAWPRLLPVQFSRWLSLQLIKRLGIAFQALPRQMFSFTAAGAAATGGPLVAVGGARLVGTGGSLIRGRLVQ